MLQRYRKRCRNSQQESEKPLEDVLAESHEVLFELLHVTSIELILKTGVPQMNHFICKEIKKKKNQISRCTSPLSPKKASNNSGDDALRASGCGEDQEAGEGVARAALTHDGVVPGHMQ